MRVNVRASGRQQSLLALVTARAAFPGDRTTVSAINSYLMTNSGRKRLPQRQIKTKTSNTAKQLTITFSDSTVLWISEFDLALSADARVFEMKKFL